MSTLRYSLVLLSSLGLFVTGVRADADDSRVLVRLTTSEASGRISYVTGRLMSMDADKYVLATEFPGDVVRVPRENVVDFEQGARRSRTQGMKRGAARGLAGGALAGALLGLASGLGGGDSGGFISFGPGSLALMGGVAFGGVGGALGAAYGAANPGHRWVSLGKTSGRVSLVAPARGVGGAVSIRF